MVYVPGQINIVVTEPVQEETALSGAAERQEAVSGRNVSDIVKSAAKLVLTTVKEVSDALPPLKSVATALTLIVEHVEVCVFLLLSRYSIPEPFV